MREFAIKTFLAALAVFAPIQAVVITVGVLIFADLATGIWAAKKRGEVIKSSKMRDSITKLLIYQTVIMTGFLVETFLLDGLLPVVKLAAAVIGMVELKSLLENANSILGRDLFKEILSKLGSKNRE